MLGIEIVGIKLAHPMMKAQPFAQPTRGSWADQRRAVVGGDAETLQQASMPVGPIRGAPLSTRTICAKQLRGASPCHEAPCNRR